ncbi:hypothetical protein PHYSODRAFT_508970, partial [Phytophthora sojae]
LKELPPLEPIDVGVVDNWVFFIRGWLVAAMLRSDSALWADVKQVLAGVHCFLSLPFIYPLYIYEFVSLSGTAQVLFVAVLPIMKLIAKNWMNFTLTGQDEAKPEMIVFVVEFFNSLYISNALQSTSSWMSTATVMASDLGGFCLSMVEIVEVFIGITKLMEKIPQHHPLAKENFVQVLLRILAANEANKDRQDTQKTDSKHSSKKTNLSRDPSPATIHPDTETTHEMIVYSEVPKRKLFQGSQVVPASIPQNQLEKGQITKSTTATALADMNIETIFSRKERDLFIRKSLHVLFITEYVVLFEYIEVMSPIVHSLFRVVLFHLPNRIYFSTMQGLTSSELASSTLTVLAYSSLEFISFVIAVAVMKRTLGFNPLRQLAFVLDTQACRIQIKLIVILLYVTQMPLAHLGADFSFKFAWIPGYQTTSS